MEKYCDNIFEKLNGIKNPDLWYKARNFVLSSSSSNKNDGFANVVFDELTVETLAVARQIALVAHYMNYNETTGENRSIITFYGCETYGIGSIDDVEPKMKDYFGNLFDFCQYSFNGGEPKNKNFQDIKNNNWLPLDIEFHFQLGKMPEGIKNPILASEVKASFDKYTQPATGIDVTQGMLVNMVYTTGITIDNLPACDNDNVARYDTALRVYCYKLKTEHIKETWDETAKIIKGEYQVFDIKNQLSSIFCADCFESRLNGILDTSKKSLREYLLHDFDTVMKKVNENINALAYCEHNRWNVEKLIMGFSPLDTEERYQLECLFDQEKKDKIKHLKKKEFKHIDLCSNRDLRRVNPADVKYDYFLMLAMPQILLSTMR